MVSESQAQTTTRMIDALDDETIRRVQYHEEIHGHHRVRPENGVEHHGDDHLHVHGLDDRVRTADLEYGLHHRHTCLLFDLSCHWFVSNRSLTDDELERRR